MFRAGARGTFARGGKKNNAGGAKPRPYGDAAETENRPRAGTQALT